MEYGELLQKLMVVGAIGVVSTAGFGLVVLLGTAVKAIIKPVITQVRFFALSEEWDEMGVVNFVIPPSFSTLLADVTALPILEYYDVVGIWDRIMGRRVGLAVVDGWFVLMVQDRRALKWFFCPYKFVDWWEKWLRKDWRESVLTYLGPDGKVISTMAVPDWAFKSVRHVFRMARKNWRPPADQMHEEGAFR